MAFEGGLGSVVNFQGSVPSPISLSHEYRQDFGRQEDRRTDNMAEVEREAGVWRDGAYLFPDGRGGSFSRNEIYRDSKGVLRFHIVFVSSSVTG